MGSPHCVGRGLAIATICNPAARRHHHNSMAKKKFRLGPPDRAHDPIAVFLKKKKREKEIEYIKNKTKKEIGIPTLEKTPFKNTKI